MPAVVEGDGISDGVTVSPSDHWDRITAFDRIIAFDRITAIDRISVFIGYLFLCGHNEFGWD